ncbi:MAG: RNA 2',3'-cyclic phosphodiesterase [Candidatus Rokuibacteriota bacterium]|nr:MAG: RNA 2',3'-cyclic phosphodiesterase [Candidatus Rokubacteria bacterium]
MGGRSIAGVRAFVAILLPDAVRAKLGAEIERLRACGRNVAWVASDNLHVTLKFLGHVEPSRLDDAVSALTVASAVVAPFDLDVAGLGAFPSSTRPRVLWAGLAEGADAAAKLARSIDSALAGHGFPPEDRPFAGHVTLGRVREPRGDRELASALAASARQRFGRFTVDRVALMRSELSSRGAHYSILAALPLSASPDPTTTTR